VPPANKSSENLKNFAIVFGQRFRFLREKLGLSQTELAAKLGYATYQAIGRFERGERLPRVKALLHFVNLGDFNLHWLITGKPSPDGEAWRADYAELLRIYHTDAGEWLDRLEREIKDWQKKVIELTEGDSRGDRINIGELERCKEEIAVRQSKVVRIREHMKRAFDRYEGVRFER